MARTAEVPERGVRRALVEAERTGRFRFDDGELTELPYGLRRLKGLRHLSVRQNQISHLPEWIGELTALETIDLAENPLRALPPSMGELANLQGLGLMGAKSLLVFGFPLGRLENLEMLSIGGTRLWLNLDDIGDLPRLRSLEAGGADIGALPRSLGRLRRLSHLHLWGHGLDRFPDELRGLDGLEVLELSSMGASGRERVPRLSSPVTVLTGRTGRLRGRIRDLPPDLGEWLPSLQVLTLDDQRVRHVPSLPARLQVLSAADNDLEEIPAAALDAPRLERLVLRGNVIARMPVDAAPLRRLAHLDLRDNRLDLPPEILGDVDRPGSVVGYVSELRSGAVRPLNEAKLLVVGEGTVGKTSLVRRLMGRGFCPSENKTEGIDVHRWQVELGVDDEVDLNVWDFGGQEIMHATHQFFLTKRSLYLLVIDARQDETQNRLEYWLKLIQGYSDGSPVIIVGNKVDQHQLDLDVRRLRSKYPSIADIVAVSCRDDTGVDELSTAIADATRTLDHVRDPLPVSFFDVKAELEASDADYLTFEEFEGLCGRHRIRSAELRTLLVSFLHVLGTVVCFRDDPRLADTNILNPAWVTGGVYAILNAHRTATKRGLLTLADFEAVLPADTYPAGRMVFIIELMKKFELCFEADGTYLVPDLLTKQEPDTGDWSDALIFEIAYDVLPGSIIARLAVRLSRLISKGTVWRSGMVLADGAARAHVHADYEEATIVVAVTGRGAQRRQLLGVIRAALRDIGESIPGLEVVERVPVPGHEGVWVPYDHLLDLEAAGRSVVIPHGMTDELAVGDLLAGVEEPGSRSSTSRATPSDEEAEIDEPVARPWSAKVAFQFGAILLGVLVGALGAFALGVRLAGPGAGVAIAVAAVAAALVVGVLMLRSGGRMSDSAVAEVLGRALEAVNGGAGPVSVTVDAKIGRRPPDSQD